MVDEVSTAAAAPVVSGRRFALRIPHAPGPWVAQDESGAYRSSDGWRVEHDEADCVSWAPIFAGEKLIAFVVSEDWLGQGDTEMDANARLIAAAPELLAALKAVVADIQDYERVNNLAPNPGKQDCWQSVTLARAAIARAEGQP